MATILIFLAVIILIRYYFWTRNKLCRHEIETDLKHLHNDLYLHKDKFSGAYKEEGFDLLDFRIRLTTEDVHKLSFPYIWTQTNGRMTKEDIEGFKQYQARVEKILDSDPLFQRFQDELMMLVYRLTIDTSALMKAAIHISIWIMMTRKIFSGKSERTLSYPLKQRVSVVVSKYESIPPSIAICG